jgi:hypothetical protein
VGLDRDAERERGVSREDALEGAHAGGVEGRAGLLVKEPDRLVVAPGIAVDPHREQRVVDVAHGEDAFLDDEL